MDKRLLYVEYIHESLLPIKIEGKPFLVHVFAGLLCGRVIIKLKVGGCWIMI